MKLMDIRPFSPLTLDNGAMVEMDTNNEFWALDAEDAGLLPVQGEERTLFVLEHLVTQ